MSVCMHVCLYVCMSAWAKFSRLALPGTSGSLSRACIPSKFKYKLAANHSIPRKCTYKLTPNHSIPPKFTYKFLELYGFIHKFTHKLTANHSTPRKCTYKSTPNHSIPRKFTYKSIEFQDVPRRLQGSESTPPHKFDFSLKIKWNCWL